MPRLEKLRRPGHGEKLGAAWRTVWLVLYGPSSVLVKTRYRHLERMPATGPAIIVVNHVSHVDPVLVSKMVIDAARTPRFLAKDSIFQVPVVGAAMRGMGHIPVKRGSMEAMQSLAAAVDALAHGRLIVLHPEGTVTRDPDGWPMAGKTGAARLALLAPEVPVIPVAQWGVQESIDLYRRRVRLVPRPRHTLSIGVPIDLSGYRDKELTGAVLREVTEALMYRLRGDVAELRGLPGPRGELYRWPHGQQPSKGAA
ncbi:MAG: 1-acyl-sn-glycerol-3-phosphate acyltransferase [Pseudonocardiales bacterium]|nr:MAG: 1-acyl-sn-glycerol-3-phosphate acyltransferase [Pseudonocardiales bacterium]